MIDSGGPVVAFHAVNYTGIGHVSRQTALARYVRQRHPDITPVVMSPCAALREVAHDLPTLTLPYVPDVRTCPPRISRAIDVATGSALSALRPDVLVYDHIAWPALRKIADSEGVAQVLCLRPRRGLKYFLFGQESPVPYMDLIYVPEFPDEYPELHEMLTQTGSEVIWTGPVHRQPVATEGEVRVRIGAEADTKVCVVSSGGGSGADSQEFIQACLTAFHGVGVEDLLVVLVVGPLMRGQVNVPARFPHTLQVQRGGVGIPELLACADVVLCRGGYGSMNETAASGARVLAYPADRGIDDQGDRVDRFVQRGVCEMITSLDPLALSEQIGTALDAGRRKTTQLPSDGLERLADRIAQLAH
ncbi:glycosyltransferase [Streptomyces lavendulae]|uniref:glycosyltransferase n=1 Tax=Streptomyces lavendulae TaxID=1914 RepID=UPI0037F3EE94